MEQPYACDALPDLALSLILNLLPVDERLRCHEVCSAWRKLLSAPQLWEVCDLSDRSIAAKQTQALLDAASVAAGGRMRVLDVSGWKDLDLDALVAVAEANAETLIELSALRCTIAEDDEEEDEGWEEYEYGTKCFEAHHIEALLDEAPELQILRCDFRSVPQEVISFLAEDKRLFFGEVRVWATDGNQELSGALAEALTRHASLSSLVLVHFNFESVDTLVRLVDVGNKLTALTLHASGPLGEACVPYFSRLLSSPSLKELHIDGSPVIDTLFKGDGVAAFIEALRTTQLTSLTFKTVNLFEEGGGAGLSVMAACVGHPTIRKLGFEGEIVDWGEEEGGSTLDAKMLALGQAAGALIAADSALTSLSLEQCMLDDAAMKPIFEAVAASTRLCELDLASSNGNITAECATEVVLPAVRSNESLRSLRFSIMAGEYDTHPLKAAMDIVSARRGS